VGGAWRRFSAGGATKTIENNPLAIGENLEGIIKGEITIAG